MAAVPLPTELEDRLAALAARLRRLRAARGACVLLLAALASTGAVVLFDAAFDLSLPARCVIQVAWLGLIAGLTLSLVVRPWQTEVSPEELAAAIDRQFPGLGDRLLTVDGLRAGPPHLLPVLARDTDRRVRSLDVSRAAPARPVARLAVATGLIATAAVGVLTVPGAGASFRRVAAPWLRPGGVAPFEVVVTSGDPVVRRGEPVTLAAYLRATDSAAALPAVAVLVVRGGTVPDQVVPMTGGPAAAFHATLPPPEGDFEYRVEAGATASGWHAVVVADPVDVTAATRIEVTPPAYTHSPPAAAAGFTDVRGLPFSEVAVRLRFDRPVESAALDFLPESRPAGEDADRLPIELSPDRTGGTARFPLRTSGTLRLVLVNEPGPRTFRTELTAPVRVTADAPPRFERVAGVFPLPFTARPGDRLPVGVTATDDIAVTGAEIEYTVGSGGTPARLPIPLTGAGTPHAEGWTLFEPAGVGRAGDVIRYRVRVTDGRRIDEANLGPQEAVYPPTGWAELRLSASAPPLDQQEMGTRRDATHAALATVLKGVNAARADVAVLRADTAGRSPLPVDHASRLDALRDRVRQAAARLRDTAADLDLTPELRPFAASVRDAADQPLGNADESFRQATTDHAGDRQAVLGTTLARLDEAAGRLGKLVVRNDRLARDRLDRRRLAALAVDQAALADRAKARTGGSPAPLLAAQRDLHDRLHALLADSESLRRGVDAATGRVGAVFAAEAEALAAQLGDLDAASARLTAGVRQTLLDGLAREQGEFADRAARFYPTIDTAARVARVRPPTSADFRRAADLLAHDRVVDALVEMEKFAQSLDRTADEFEKWAAERADPKAAARQLARWQDDLRGRLAGATAGGSFTQLPAAHQAVVRTEQRALLRATERLKLPPDPGVTALRDAAVVHLRLASQRADGDGSGLDAAMKNAAETLGKLADTTPAAAVRFAGARPELDAIRIEQDAIAVAADAVFRQYDRPPLAASQFQTLAARLAPLQERQRVLADRLGRLDLPGLDSRIRRTVRELTLAAADLRAGLPHDAAASLATAKTALDRLKHAADGTAPHDDLAADLARRQGAVAAALARLGDAPTVKQLEPLVATQSDIARQVKALAAPESPPLLNDAREAVALSDASFRQRPRFHEAAARARAAADALEVLAGRLAGREPDAARVRRLAGNRRRAEADARRLAGGPPHPDASARAVRQLDAEALELAVTRVGTAGQGGKRRALDLYARLRQKTEPDRQAADQKQLADALTDLAGSMAGVAELTTGAAGGVADGADPVDAFLPSEAAADVLRAMARQQRAARGRANQLGQELTSRLRLGGELLPQTLAAFMGGGGWERLATRAAANPEPSETVTAVAELTARHGALAARGVALAARLDHAARDASPGEPAGAAFTEAAGFVGRAGKSIADAREKAAGGNATGAAKLRAEAALALRQASEALGRVASVRGADHPAAVGDAVREAERAMRRVLEALGETDGAGAAGGAMREAGNALGRAARVLAAEIAK